MEPLMTKNDNFSFSFYKALLERMKCHKDKRRPEDEIANQVSRLLLPINYLFTFKPPFWNEAAHSCLTPLLWSIRPFLTFFKNSD